MEENKSRPSPTLATTTALSAFRPADQIPPGQLTPSGEHKIPSVTRLKVAFGVFLVLMVVALSGLIILLVTRIFHELTPSMRAELEWKVKRGAVELAQSSDLGLALGDPQVVRNAFSDYRGIEDVLAIIAIDTNDRVVAVHGRSPVALNQLFSTAPGEISMTENYAASWAPSTIEGKGVGRVALVLSTARLQAGERLRRNILAAALIGCIVALGASLAFVSIYLGPLINLTQQTLRHARDMEIARRIQTSILPRRIDVEALKISAAMIPAEDVGGDYYDVIPCNGGCWIGIGDVAGHGVQAGLIMLMVQSAISALTKQNPNTSPREVLAVVNRVLYDNIRSRLVSDEHITFTLMRYHADGRVVFAGAHEDMIVCRAATGACELVPTPGTWLGAVPEIGGALVETTTELQPGDVVVLYTDGVTEARNTGKQQFDLTRLCKIVEENRNAPVDEIQRAVLDGLLAWTEIQDDDVTLMVMRYKGATA